VSKKFENSNAKTVVNDDQLGTRERRSTGVECHRRIQFLAQLETVATSKIQYFINP
jgi:hypothetical protein